MTSQLTLADTSPWSGSLRLGLRSLVARSLIVEASLGYLSIGQNGLDTWEGRLFVSYGF
ncbi:hypothetical protein [Rivibacter subsaxonicus]|uniref:Outer membrane autotransporter protein n=1 Tax=Rivibacter subsaxonicus TaxID=457575 RepID=A0A4Q7VG44_9BURK|nr:hypothetical protein [Rivibacter subsaxonicus]RZT94980.1 hypothetical protein EV670_2726 [Rivibacter subsaxonicus]